MAQNLTAPQRAIVAEYWWRRAASEITSWVGWQHVLEDLRAEGSPGTVLKLAERAVHDEYQHAVWCRDWAERFGHQGGEVRPRGDERFAFPDATDSDNRICRIALCCFTETVGCFTLQQVRPLVRDPALRKLNRRHLADEMQHSRTGWAHLSTLDVHGRESLRRYLPRLLALLPRVCCGRAGEEHEDLVPFGYFTARVLTSAHDEAVRSVILPGLEHLKLAEAS